MKILVDKRINTLFGYITFYMVIFIFVSVAVLFLKPLNGELYMLLFGVCMFVAVEITLYKYFTNQNIIMENAAAKIKEYISGNQEVRIDCNHEGQLYRLFHEINSMISILNAHIENEGKSKAFLKDTISNISHQLKTPLAALNIYNGIIQEEVSDNSTIKEFVDLSEQELDRIEILVQNLLKITKLDAGTIILEKSEESMGKIIMSVERQFAVRAKKEYKKIILSGDNDIIFLCDRNWMIEAISNLVKNSLDHTQNGNEIHIEWKKLTSIVQVTVKDNGSGIHPEDLPHIFKRFYRSRFSKDTQGIGLGLSLTKAIIESHSGTIEVDSELGIGSTFTINFLL